MPTAPPCPDSLVLEKFALGQLPPAEVELLAGHVERCARCIDLLDTLKDTDALLNDLQAQGSREPEPPLPLMEQWCALGSQGYSTDTVEWGGLLKQLAGAPADATQEICDFLAPPDGPGVLGRLGRYRVLRVLGAGGMGIVFEAEDTDLRRRVALKALRPGLASSTSARRRFLREGQAAAALTHDRIVPIYEVGEDRGVPFLAMPLLLGETLEDRLRRPDPLPIAEVVRIGREIAEGVAAAHAAGLIHRDIKPSNVWLEDTASPAASETAIGPVSAATSPDGRRVKLLDFGLARTVGGDAHLTQSGVVVGTPAYMAPEQARGEAVDQRSDLFSLGCVLYRACTGKVPFPGANALATLLALAKANPLPPSKWNPGLPPGLSDLVLKLLAHRPEDRYPSAAAVLEALDAVASGKVKALRPRRRAGLALAAAGLLGILALAGYQLIQNGWLGDEAADPNGADTEQVPAELFAPAVSYPAGLYPHDVAVADFNGDGKLDLVVANLQSHSVSVLLGNGDGTFRPPLTSKSGEWFAWSVTVADLDGDGKPDLVVANQGSHQISVLRGKGDGTFWAPVQYGVGSSPNAVAVADLNGDGKPDLAVANGDGSVSILLGKGDGTFRGAVSHAAGTSCHSVVVADFNRDGKPDLAVADFQGQRIGILLGKGDGTFQRAVHYPVPKVPSQVAAADLNGDGKVDLVTANANGGVSVLLGNGDGSFQAAADYGAGQGFGRVIVADLDGDGRPDLALAPYLAGDSPNTIRLLLGNGDGSFRLGPALAAGRKPFALAVGDFNGDGAADLAVANRDSNDLSVLLHRSPPPYQAHLGPPVDYAAGKEPLAVVVGDFDRDGKADIAVADRAGHAVHLLRGNGDGSFRKAVRFPAGKGPAALAAGDFNRDARLDLAVADSEGDAVSVLLGKGEGRFADPVPYSVGNRPAAVAVSDFDRDGKPDIVTANYGASSVSVLMGKGDGTFTAARNFPAGIRPKGLTVADFNGDGKLDLAVANYAQVGTVSVLLGKGNGTFGSAVSYPVGSYPVAVVGADVNRDGKTDLVVANYGSQDINVLLGKGDGTFHPAVNYNSGDMPFGLAAADLNGDGKLDLVVASSHTNLVSVLPGNGDGTFQPPLPYYGTGLYPTDLAIGFLRSSARLDLVTANARGGSVSVFLNRPAAPFLVAFPVIDALGSDEMACNLSVSACQAGQPRRPDTRFRGTVRFSSSDPRAILPGAYTFLPADKGSHAFRLKFRTPGSQTLTITDVGGHRLAARTAVWVLRLADLRFIMDIPKSVPAGKPFNVTVNLMTPQLKKGSRDELDVWTSGYGGTIRFRCTDPKATLPADYTFDRSKQLATFPNVKLPTPGTWTITVTDTALPTLTASATVTVRPAPRTTTGGD